MKVEWTDDFEQKLRTKLEEEYKQADNLVVWASGCDRPLQKGLINIEKSADKLIGWIKNELGV